MSPEPRCPGDPDYVLRALLRADARLCLAYCPEDDVLFTTLLDALDGFFAL